MSGGIEHVGVRPVEPETGLTARAYAEIRRAILEGRIPPGQLTSVRALSEALGISRTPVREALVELAKAGMVAFERNRGVRVVVTLGRDVEEIFQLRLWLEVPAALEAVPRCGGAELEALARTLDGMRAHLDDEHEFMRHDWRFHRTLLAATGNDRLVGFVAELRDQTRMRGISTVGRSRRLEAILAEHDAIYAHVQAGDASAAADAMADHLSTTRDLLLAQDPPATTPEDV
ncbi:GntR family transcriptional regulator [Conexibacter woesei]|uniref:Transcriptional regulator, GntR family n=1 Tax=Conexibacter woesei (strain DSM 14684 / CCUG 47730 / CIP 108061 / JCM 11494 / NBRC 100937 / ID131577) TaxID=469383 RepID=D3F4K5_CONWI|nr:GntR family transcriptional regulator [Conexibacter woesei]ADB52462.1 transcriptional regulator, GntR family [Conexibacter woesei DSM 14684]